jgi:hypothetical protein
VSAGSPADVLSLLNTITGVCGCARRRPLLLQHDDGCLRVRSQTSFPSATTGVCGCSCRRPLPPQHDTIQPASSTLTVHNRRSHLDSSRPLVDPSLSAVIDCFLLHPRVDHRASDVSSLFNTLTGVRGCSCRRPFTIQHGHDTLRARHPQSFPIDSPRPFPTGPSSSTHAYRLCSTHPHPTSSTVHIHRPSSHRRPLHLQHDHGSAGALADVLSPFNTTMIRYQPVLVNACLLTLYTVRSIITNLA